MELVFRSVLLAIAVSLSDEQVMGAPPLDYRAEDESAQRE
jgi:hypothetical protein